MFKRTVKMYKGVNFENKPKKVFSLLYKCYRELQSNLFSNKITDDSIFETVDTRILLQLITILLMKIFFYNNCLLLFRSRNGTFSK